MSFLYETWYEHSSKILLGTIAVLIVIIGGLGIAFATSSPTATITQYHTVTNVLTTSTITHTVAVGTNLTEVIQTVIQPAISLTTITSTNSNGTTFTITNSTVITLTSVCTIGLTCP